MLQHNNAIIQDKVNKLLPRLSDKSQLATKLNQMAEDFWYNHGLTVIIGAEIEFYLQDLDIDKFLQQSEIAIVKEKGHNQFEAIIEATDDPVYIAYAIDKYTKYIKDLAQELNGKALFNPKPFANDYGNGMHLHINFLDNTGSNIFGNKNILDLCASALCQFMQSSFLIFAPTAESYQRFSKGYMSPTHISYGRNNRTTALRVPDHNPRIEYRLGSPICNPHLMLYALFLQLEQAFANPANITKQPIIYGNAYDEQYNLQKLPANLFEAYECFAKAMYV